MTHYKLSLCYEVGCTSCLLSGHCCPNWPQSVFEALFSPSSECSLSFKAAKSSRVELRPFWFEVPVQTDSRTTGSMANWAISWLVNSSWCSSQRAAFNMILTMLPTKSDIILLNLFRTFSRLLDVVWWVIWSAASFCSLFVWCICDETLQKTEELTCLPSVGKYPTANFPIFHFSVRMFWRYVASNIHFGDYGREINHHQQLWTLLPFGSIDWGLSGGQSPE